VWTDHDELPDDLRRYVHALRADVPVRAAWRESLLREIVAARPPRRARRWSVTPTAAIAAGLACMALGGGATWWATGRAPAHATVARSPMDASVVRFALLAPGASRVTLVGDFNRWDPSATPLRESADGRTWEVRVPLSPGRHVYAFVVDGGLRADPAAPRTVDDDFGAPSSVVLVGGSS
jgi:Carbohydrate-binding module 48 (Isoamylase N-terminal domain)